MSNTAHFKIQRIDQEHGQLEVRFINFLGPIFTGEKFLNDFKKKVDVGTGNFTQEGKEITKEIEIFTNDNPNQDLVYSIDIPLTETGSFINGEDLLKHIAKHYPSEHFIKQNKIKLTPVDENINNLLDKTFEVEIEYPVSSQFSFDLEQNPQPEIEEI